VAVEPTACIEGGMAASPELARLDSALRRAAALVEQATYLTSEVRTGQANVRQALRDTRNSLAALRRLLDETESAQPGHRRRRRARAEEDLVLQHVGLAYSLAGRYMARGEDLDDLRQVATLGLVKAARRYDPNRGVKFATYATANIVGEIKRHFRDKRWGVHVPRADQELYLRVRDAADGLSTQLGRSPTVAEIADRAGVSSDDVVLAQELSMMFELRSLDAVKRNEAGDERRIDLGETDSSFELIESLVNLRPALAALTEDERQLISLRFADGLSQSDIGHRIGVSQMQVSRMLSSTLARLRATVGP